MKAPAEFTSYIFQENTEKTERTRVVRERPLFLGILVTLIGCGMMVLEISFASFVIVSGILVTLAGQFILSGKATSIGHHPKMLRLTKDAVFIGDERIGIFDKNDIEIGIAGFTGLGRYLSGSAAIYRTFNGNENTIRIRRDSRIFEAKFVLNSVHHKDKLIAFCKENDFKYTTSLEVKGT
jgi:hypothetical protein